MELATAAILKKESFTFILVNQYIDFYSRYPKFFTKNNSLIVGHIFFSQFIGTHQYDYLVC